MTLILIGMLCALGFIGLWIVAAFAVVRIGDAFDRLCEGEANDGA